MKRAKHSRVKIGDVFVIPLPNGGNAYGQYVFQDKKMGPLVQIFDLITEHKIQVDQLQETHPLFRPVITGLFAVIRSGLWEIIGTLPVKNFLYPMFISTLENEDTGHAGVWYLWDGEKSLRLGYTVPDEYKDLEFLCVWSPYDISRRIETGEKPYDTLIRTNTLR